MTEVLQPTHSLKELAKQTKFAGVPFYEMNSCRKMIESYIAASCLDKVSDIEGAAPLKGGQIRIDPLLYGILNPKPAG